MLNFLSFQFDTKLMAHELPLFRAAIIEKVGREYDLFHNHINKTQYIHRYPLIQYKRINSRPTIVCMGKGTEDIIKLFEKDDMQVQIGEREVQLKIMNLNLKEFDLKLSEKWKSYQISNWIALNQQNYAKYQHLPTEPQRLEFLEKTLTGHILGFANAVDWHIDAPLKVRISPDIAVRPCPYKSQKLMGFTLSFATNALLPYSVGLGGKVALGYGIVHPTPKH